MREWVKQFSDELPDGAKLLNNVHAFLGRFVAYPTEHAHVAHTLWIAHTHLMDSGIQRRGLPSFRRNQDQARPERWR